MAISLADIIEYVGVYPSKAKDFSKQIKKFAEVVKTYVDAAAPPADEGSADQILTTNGSVASWEDAPAGGGGISTVIDHSANADFTAESNTRYILSSEIITSINIKLPESPTYGDVIEVYILQGSAGQHQVSPFNPMQSIYKFLDGNTLSSALVYSTYLYRFIYVGIEISDSGWGVEALQRVMIA